MNCKVCGDDNSLDAVWCMLDKCRRCDLILSQLIGLRNTPARERLHLINCYIARGVDD